MNSATSLPSDDDPEPASKASRTGSIEARKDSGRSIESASLPSFEPNTDEEEDEGAENMSSEGANNPESSL